MDDVGKDLRDGILIAKLLKHYGIVNSKSIKNILSSDNPVVCENNLRQLCIWFSVLGIKFNSEIISKISNAKTTTCLQVLYDLYLALHNKERLYFVNEEKRKSKKPFSQYKPPDKILSSYQFFCCDKVSKEKISQSSQPESSQQKDDTKISQTPLQESREKNFVKENIDKKQKIIIKNDLLLEKKNNKDKEKMEDIAYVRNELQYVTNQHVMHKENLLSFELKDNKTKLLDMTSESYTKSKTSCENLIMNNIWKDIENQEKEKLKKIISQNLLKQSLYEKQLAMKKFQRNLQEKVNQTKFQETKDIIEKERKKEDFFQSSYMNSEAEITFQTEMIQKMELHKKLYAKRLKTRFRKHYAMCLQTVKDLIDLAINKSEYSNEPDALGIWLQWKQMFINGQPLFYTTEDNPQESGNISVIDTEPQEELNNRDFEEYFLLTGDWFKHAGSDITIDDQSILGYIVHRLLQAKYQKYPPLKPADLPKYSVTAVLNGTINQPQLQHLKILLIKPKICFVDVQSAITFCIECYKDEAGIKDENIDKKDSQASAKKKKGTTSSDKTKLTNFSEKEVQTSTSLLDVKKPVEPSQASQLGRYFYEMQSSYDNVPTTYIADALIEFLKSQKNIKGWVLYNFPSTLQEAYIIERNLTGKRFPQTFHQQQDIDDEFNDTYYLQQSITLERLCQSSTMATPKLVILTPLETGEFKTYFSSFINVINSQMNKNPGSIPKTEVEDELNNILLENEEDSTSNQTTEESNLSIIDVYKKEGIIHEVFYDASDIGALKNIARLILSNNDENKIHEKPSLELFGKEILEYLTPTKKKTPKSRETQSTIIKKLKENLLLDEKSHPSDAETKIEYQQEILSSSEEKLTGQKEYTYTNFPIAEGFLIILANMWESMEKEYISKISGILYRKRKDEEMNSTYINNITQKIKAMFTKNEKNQNIIKRYLSDFNSASLRDRAEKETKDKLCYSVFDLEIKLWEISNDRKNRIENERKNLINQNWIVNGMIKIANNYISMLHVETERCVLTLHIITDYYALMCGKDEIKFSPKISLPKFIELDNDDLQSTITEILTEEANINIENPVCKILKEIVDPFLANIQALILQFNNLVEEQESLILNSLDEYLKNKKEDKQHHSEHNTSVLAETKENTVKNNISVLAEAKENTVKNMFREWSCALKNEIDRVIWRSRIIEKKANENILKLEESMKNVFHNTFCDIKTEYFKENKYIDELCKLLHKAIDENTPLQDIVIEENYIYNQNEFITDIPDEMEKNECVQLVPDIWNKMNSFQLKQLFKLAFGSAQLVNWKDFLVYCLELPFPDMEDVVEYRLKFISKDEKHGGTVSYHDYKDIVLWFENQTENKYQEAQIESAKEIIFSLFKINETEMDYNEFILTFCKDFNQKIGFSKCLAYLIGKCVITSERDIYLEQILQEHNLLLSNMIQSIINEIIFDVINSVGLKIEEVRESTQLYNEDDNHKSKVDDHEKRTYDIKYHSTVTEY
ncbi:sperm flagellar protein 2-like [Lycorma delicatula]|uniref:sperm flagellar protein 2-like n=1 Tax=Lycorma delicatula TaxID=130591 RepID=UPI003F5193B0